MAFTTNVERIMRDYESKRAELIEQRDNPAPNELYSNPDIVAAINAEAAKEINAQIDQLTVDSSAEIQAELDGYMANLKARYTKTPDNVDATDLALLSGAVKLTKQDVEAMFERNAGNPAMQQIVVDYNHEHELGADVVFYGQEMREDAARNYAVGAMQCIKNPDSLQWAFYVDGKAVPPCLVGE